MRQVFARYIKLALGYNFSRINTKYYSIAMHSRGARIKARWLWAVNAKTVLLSLCLTPKKKLFLYVRVLNCESKSTHDEKRACLRIAWRNASVIRAKWSTLYFEHVLWLCFMNIVFRTCFMILQYRYLLIMCKTGPCTRVLYKIS